MPAQPNREDPRTAGEPIAGYDDLETSDLIASLSSHSPAELAAIESYERAHRNRKAVFTKLRRLRGVDHGLRKKQGLSSDEVVTALRRSRARRGTADPRNTKR